MLGSPCAGWHHPAALPDFVPATYRFARFLYLRLLALCLGLDASRKGSTLMALAYGGGEAVASSITATRCPG